MEKKRVQEPDAAKHKKQAGDVDFELNKNKLRRQENKLNYALITNWCATSGGDNRVNFVGFSRCTIRQVEVGVIKVIDKRRHRAEGCKFDALPGQ